MRDLYQLLGLQPDASLEQITRAYRRCALKAHPDRGGSNEQMGALNEAYRTLSNAISRQDYNAAWEIYKETDPDYRPPATHIRGALLAGNTPAYSQEFRNKHAALNRKYQATPLQPVVGERPLDLSKHFATYELRGTGTRRCVQETHKSLFTFIQAQTRRMLPQPIPVPQANLTPESALHLFSEFLQGRYYGESLDNLKLYLTQQLERIAQYSPENRLYEGISEIIHCAGTEATVPDTLIFSLKKIADYAKEPTSVARLPEIIPVFYNPLFRGLYAQALELYWNRQSAHPFTPEHFNLFDGYEATQDKLKEARSQLSGDMSNQRLADQVRHLKLMLSYERDQRKARAMSQTASDYRIWAFHFLDWLPAFLQHSNQRTLINLFLQIGFCFHQASRLEMEPSLRMADESLAKEMYLTVAEFGHHATPDISLYANTQAVKYMLSFQYKELQSAQILSILQERVLATANLFPFFDFHQPNIACMEREQNTLRLMRHVLNAMYTLYESNKTSANPVALQHPASTILYQVFEACLKHWFRAEYSPEFEYEVRLNLMEELLFENNWTFLDVEQHLDAPWIMVDRDENGWLKPTASLPYADEDPEHQPYASINGAEINMETGQVDFFMTPWSGALPANKKLFSLRDLQEMLEKNLSTAIFSLDPASPDKPYHPYNFMRFEPKQLFDSELLDTMLLTDYMLKFFTTGQEVQGQHPFDQRPSNAMLEHMPGCLRRLIDDFRRSNRKPAALHRFWIEAEEMDLNISDASEENPIQRLELGKIRMVVKKHCMRYDLDGNLVDTEHENEGWPVYVLTRPQMNGLLRGTRTLSEQALIVVRAEKTIYFWDTNGLVKEWRVDSSHLYFLRKIFGFQCDAQGKIQPDTRNISTLYPAVRAFCKQAGLPHQYSPEFIFAHEFTTHYDEIALFLPEFARLKELSKMVVLVRVLTNIRDGNQETIRALKHLTNPRRAQLPAPTDQAYSHHYSQYQEQMRHVESQVRKFNDQYSHDSCRSHWLGRLEDIRRQLSANYTARPEEKIRAVVQVLSPHFPASYSHYEKDRDVQLFMGGNPENLANTLAESDVARISEELRPQFPRSSPREVNRAVGYRDPVAISNLARGVVNQLFEELLEKKESFARGFQAIKLGPVNQPTDLEGVCLWVPASVRHEMREERTSEGLARYSFFSYGGVNINPRVNLGNRGGASPLGGNRVGGGTFNRAQIIQGFQNHHIISNRNQATQNHRLLGLTGFNINSRANMIYLPTRAEMHPTRTIHLGRHTGGYSRHIAGYMNRIVETGQSQNWSQQQYREKLREMLSELRQEFRAGTIGLNRNMRPGATRW